MGIVQLSPAVTSVQLQFQPNRLIDLYNICFNLSNPCLYYIPENKPLQSEDGMTDEFRQVSAGLRVDKAKYPGRTEDLSDDQHIMILLDGPPE